MSSEASGGQQCSGVARALAESGAGRVTACSCGNIHFDVEYLTLRFTPEAFRELAAMLALAQRTLDAGQPALQTPTSRRAAH